MIKNKFEELEVWKKAHRLTLKVYKITKVFPREERFRLGDQLRRSAASVTTNIVEGNSRLHKKEFQQFLNIARGSLEETKYHLMLSRDLRYLDQKDYENLQNDCDEVGRMLFGLNKSLKSEV